MNIEGSTPSISGKIESIIREAQIDLYLVSPYIQLEKSETDEWKRIKSVLKFSLNKGVNVNFIIRKLDDDNKGSLDELLKEFQAPNCKIYLIENLHSKVYYNRSEAIITSMNMYYHSSKYNYEIGVIISKQDKEELEKLENYIQFLISEATLFQNEQKIIQEKTDLEQTEDETQFVEFRVISRGYKWFKVETPKGYENKILITDASDLLVGKRYKAKARINWERTNYGINVTYTNIHDVSMI